jgi:hypothetical protein
MMLLSQRMGLAHQSDSRQSDLSLILTGAGLASEGNHSSQVLSTTTFIGSTQLVAIVPAALLANPVTAQVFVETGDWMGDIPLLPRLLTFPQVFVFAGMEAQRCAVRARSLNAQRMRRRRRSLVPPSWARNFRERRSGPRQRCFLR